MHNISSIGKAVHGEALTITLSVEASFNNAKILRSYSYRRDSLAYWEVVDCGLPTLLVRAPVLYTLQSYQSFGRWSHILHLSRSAIVYPTT